nr:AIR carboxylase family protein [Bacteroidales bacterium]
GIPVAAVAINGSLNAAILSAQMIATGDADLMKRLVIYKNDLKKKIQNANEELTQYEFKYRVASSF